MLNLPKKNWEELADSRWQKGTSADLSSSMELASKSFKHDMGPGGAKSGPIFRAPDSKLVGRQVTCQPRTTSLELRHSHERSRFLEIQLL